MSKRYFKRNEIIGKDIISDTAMRLGKIKDIGYDSEGKIVLIYDKSEGGEEAIASSQILAFGDVILVKSKSVEKTPEQTTTSTVKICPKCGKKNPADLLYCTGCGTRLEGGEE